MEIINKKLTDKQKLFFKNLYNYLDDNEIYFYGSILRNDYIYGKSDIDIDIFTDNEKKTIYILSNFLNLNKDSFKKIIYKINSKMIYGHKVKYKDTFNEIDVEFSIYNNNYKKLIIQDHQAVLNLPLYMPFLLSIIKFFYYNLNLMSKKYYSRCKQFLMNNDEIKFILYDF